MEIYSGQQPDGPYKKVNSFCEKAKRILGPLYNSGRNVTTETVGIPVMNWAISYRKIKFLSLEQYARIRRLNTPDFVLNKNREQHSTLLGFQKDIMLLSYMAEKNKCVNLLSTMHSDDHIDESTGDLKKPEVITFHNMIKGAVDIVDEMGGTYSVTRISNRWPMGIFFSLLTFYMPNDDMKVK
ncbi:uncharacterized protein LOC118186710 [Stegodyphus dumicola]|uniref:uncharacterized protein LOC118186710 n=1 Tax=Stegodyphus dumicola TaxID=202533 RepID=UPI0015B10921|nr:uncharacterized protein LOC118186710 [Stegodyphus dumicola]